MASPEGEQTDPSQHIPRETWPGFQDTRHFAVNVLHPTLRDTVCEFAEKYQSNRKAGALSPVQVFIPRPFGQNPIFQHMFRSWGRQDKLSGYGRYAFYSHDERLMMVGDGLGDMTRGEIGMHPPQPLYPLSSVGRLIVVAGALDYAAFWLCMQRPDLAEDPLRSLADFYDLQYLRRASQGEFGAGWPIPNKTSERIDALVKTITDKSQPDFPPI